MIRTAIIPAAGMGTRFLPTTKVMAKELLPVGGVTLLRHVVNEAAAAGLTRLILVSRRGSRLLEEEFISSCEACNDQRPGGDSCITPVVVRQAEPLGLGHGLWVARAQIDQPYFAVLLPDAFIHGQPPMLVEMMRYFEQLMAPMVALMSIPPEHTRRYGVAGVSCEPGNTPYVRIETMVEKPEPECAPSCLGMIGRYILPARIFSILGEARRGVDMEIQLTDAMVRLLEDGPFYGVPICGECYDCGDKLGYQKANLAVWLGGSGDPDGDRGVWLAAVRALVPGL